jgi:hypothetical protein
MTSCYIVGGGDFCYTPPNSSFIIGTNFHYKNANILVAVDEPIVKKLIQENINGFNNQPIFTSIKVGQYFSDSYRCFSYDYQKLHNIGSASSGMLAIMLADFLGFTDVNLLGFSHIKDKHKTTFLTIINKNIRYTIYDGTDNYTIC